MTSTIVLFSLLLVIVFFNHYSIQKTSKNLIYSKIEDVPHRNTAVLLGMEKKFKNGKTNRFYINRIDAAVNLYKAKKIDVIIVSRNQGNVVDEVKKDLVKRGIPKGKIILDYAGLRTYDSMYRMFKVYGQRKFIVIAQHKQNERAIYIAKKNTNLKFEVCISDNYSSQVIKKVVNYNQKKFFLKYCDFIFRLIRIW